MRRLVDDAERRGLLGTLLERRPSELLQRAFGRIDRRGGRGGRRGGRGGSGSQDLPDLTMYGLSNFSAANFYQTPNPGGEPGDVAGYGAGVLFRLSQHPAANAAIANYLFGRSNAAITQGYYMRIDGGPTGQFNLLTSNGGVGRNGQFIASDVGRLHLVLFRMSATAIDALAARGIIGSSNVTAANYVAAANRTSVGAWEHAPTHNAVNLSILGVMGFRGLPTLDQLLAYYDAARTVGDLPDSLAGATVTHHWSLRRELAGQYVVSGQAAPAQLTDRITGAAGDALAKQGAPTVVTIDPARDGRKSYGALGFAGGNYFQTAVDGGVRGSASGFWFAVHVRIEALSTAAAAIAECLGIAPNEGWAIDCGSNFSTVYFTAVSGAAAFVNSATYVATAADTMQPRLFVAVHTGTALRFYVNRAQVGSDVAIAGYTPASGQRQTFGSREAGAIPPSHLSGFGCAGGNGVPDLSEIQKLFDDVEAAGTIRPIPGKTDHLWDVTADVVASGQEVVPATVLDRVGTDHLTRVGSGLTLAQRVERVWSYETSPIIHAVGSLADSAYYETANGSPGTAAGFFYAVLFMIMSQAVSSQARMLLAKQAASNAAGYAMYTGGTNQTLLGVVTNGSGSAITGPSTIFGAADVGRLLLAFCVHDGAKVRTYVRRAELSTGTAITGYTVPTQPLRVGRHSVSAGMSAGSLQIFGWMSGHAVPSLAEIQAAHDAAMAHEDIIAIPDKTDHLWSVKRDQQGVAPATILDRIGTDHMARVGSPTLAPEYRRAWGW